MKTFKISPKAKRLFARIGKTQSELDYDADRATISKIYKAIDRAANDLLDGEERALRDATAAIEARLTAARRAHHEAEIARLAEAVREKLLTEWWRR